MTQKEIHHFFSFWHFYIFDLIFLFIYYQFPNGKARLGFCHQLLLKLSRVTWKRNKKHDFQEFSKFFSFRNFENDFGINSNDSGNSLISLELRYFFVKTLIHYKTGKLVNTYLQLHKVLLSSSEGILSYRDLKSPISRDKNMILFAKCLSN